VDMIVVSAGHLGTTEKSPHTQRGIAHRQQITPNILEVIGCTPLVKLNHIPASEGIECEMCKSQMGCKPTFPLG